ncbi:protein DDC8 homolog [Otolemur garnettii]|uniref:protein DDC8 homolog n=1 Tax=Otolemur garnettii TaxID=30611 RepID=UPI000C7F04E7|nr:protein DDC8 homolog [Otolemur garnettii]
MTVFLGKGPAKGTLSYRAGGTLGCLRASGTFHQAVRQLLRLGAPEPSALGCNHLPSEIASAGFTEMNRKLERAIRRSTGPDDEALRLGQKRKLLQVREKGDSALPRRPDANLWRSYQLQCWAEDLKAAWREAQRRQARLSAGGGRRAKDSEPDQDETLQQGATRSPRVRERYKATLREEKSREGEQAWHPRSWRMLAGMERQAAMKAMGQMYAPLCPLNKSKGKRVPSTKIGGGRHAGDPRRSRRLDLEKLNPFSAPTGEVRRMERKERETTQEGRRRLAKGTAYWANSPWVPSPEGRRRDREQLLPVGSTRKRGVGPQGCQCTCSDKSKWQKELELAFEELFNTNRKLKKHLSLHFDPRPVEAQNPDEEQATAEPKGCGSEAPREKRTADAETTPPGESRDPAAVEGPLPASKTDLKTFLDKKTKSRKYHQTTKTLLRDESQMPSPKAVAFVNDEDPPSGCAESRQACPGEATTVEDVLQPHPQDLEAGPGSPVVSVSRHKQEAEMEQRRPKQLELPEDLDRQNLSLEIHYKAELENERRERRRVRLALLKSSYPTAGQDMASSMGSSMTEEEQQNYMIHDYQRQILEQNMLHKQFLEEARKRLREFQDTC